MEKARRFAVVNLSNMEPCPPSPRNSFETAQAVELKAKRPFETCAGAGVLARAGAVVQPDINARSVPVVRLVEDVEVAVDVQIGEFTFVKTVASREHLLPKIPLAVAVKNPCFGFRVVR